MKRRVKKFELNRTKGLFHGKSEVIDMEEKCIAELKTWFGDFDFNYVTIRSTESECIFLTIYGEDVYANKTFRELGLYRVFKVGDKLEVSEDKAAGFVGTDDKSILSAVEDLIQTYERIR